MNVSDLLDQVVHILKKLSHELDDMDAVFQLDLVGKVPESYQLLVNKQGILWYPQVKEEATCTIQLTRENLFKLLKGELNPTSAWLTGKIKLQGDRSQLMKLQAIVSKHADNLPYLI